MPTLLTRLKINEVSSVDRGAGKNVKVYLTKAAGDEPVCKECGGKSGNHLAKCSHMGKAAICPECGGKDGTHKPSCSHHAKGWWPGFITSVDDLDLIMSKAAEMDELAAYFKREFTTRQREHAASTGAAMPGGGFPIENEGDLRNAIRAIGRAKNPGAARAHIKQRARSLGLTSLIPESWGKTAKADDAEHDDEDEDRNLIAEMLAEYDERARKGLIGDLMKIASDHGAENISVQRARAALESVVTAAFEVDKAEDRIEAISKSLDQCVEYLAGAVPKASSTAFHAAVAALPVAKKKGSSAMKTQTLEELTASFEKLTKRNDYLEAVLKLSDEHRAYMDLAKLDEAARIEFVAKTEDERNAIVAKTKKEMDDDEDDKKNGKKKPPFEKADLAKRDHEIEELKKRVGTFEAAEEERLCKALCRDSGLPEADHTLLAQMRKADPKAAEALLKRTKALAAQANPNLFTELGKGGGGTDDPTAAINAKADEMMIATNKSAKSPAERISIQKARMLVREQNPELAKAERDLEQRRRLGRAA